MSKVTTTFLRLPKMRVIPKIMASLTHRYFLQLGLQLPSNQVFNHWPPLKFLIKTLKTMEKLTPQKSSPRVKLHTRDLVVHIWISDSTNHRSPHLTDLPILKLINQPVINPPWSGWHESSKKMTWTLIKYQVIQCLDTRSSTKSHLVSGKIKYRTV